MYSIHGAECDIKSKKNIANKCWAENVTFPSSETSRKHNDKISWTLFLSCTDSRGGKTKKLFVCQALLEFVLFFFSLPVLAACAWCDREIGPCRRPADPGLIRPLTPGSGSAGPRSAPPRGYAPNAPCGKKRAGQEMWSEHWFLYMSAQSGARTQSSAGLIWINRLINHQIN